MRIHILEVRKGTKYTGAYMKMFAKKFSEDADKFT